MVLFGKVGSGHLPASFQIPIKFYTTCVIWQKTQVILSAKDKHIQSVYIQWWPRLYGTHELNSLNENNTLPRHMNLHHFLFYSPVFHRHCHFLYNFWPHSGICVYFISLAIFWICFCSKNLSFAFKRRQRDNVNSHFPLHLAPFLKHNLVSCSILVERK